MTLRSGTQVSPLAEAAEHGVRFLPPAATGIRAM